MPFAGSCAGHHLCMLTPDVNLHRKALASQIAEADLEFRRRWGGHLHVNSGIMTLEF